MATGLSDSLMGRDCSVQKYSSEGCPELPREYLGRACATHCTIACTS